MYKSYFIVTNFLNLGRAKIYEKGNSLNAITAKDNDEIGIMNKSGQND